MTRQNTTAAESANRRVKHNGIFSSEFNESKDRIRSVDVATSMLRETMSIFAKASATSCPSSRLFLVLVRSRNATNIRHYLLGQVTVLAV